MHPFFNKLYFCEYHTAHPENLPIFGEINISHQQKLIVNNCQQSIFPVLFCALRRLFRARRHETLHMARLEHPASVLLHPLHQSLMLTRNAHETALGCLKKITPHGKHAIHFSVLQHRASTRPVRDALSRRNLKITLLIGIATHNARCRHPLQPAIPHLPAKHLQFVAFNGIFVT